MERSTLEDLLGQMHEGLIKELLKRIQSGAATSADMTLAWKVLEDNGVPLADLRKRSGGNQKSAVDAEFLADLPFPQGVKEIG